MHRIDVVMDCSYVYFLSGNGCFDDVTKDGCFLTWS